jgi:hypothetical protein
MKRKLATLIIAASAVLSLLASAQLIDSPKPNTTAAELAAQSVVDAVNAEIVHRVAIHQICWQTIWRNARDGATPAAVLAALGPRAGLIFGFANENIEHIDRIAKMVGKARADFISDADCTPPMAFTIHSDGAVTLTKH